MLESHAIRPCKPYVSAYVAKAGMSASVMLPCQEGESPSDVKSAHVAEGNCVAAMRGGEQLEANEQPAG